MRIFTGRWGILIREEEIERGVRELLKEEGGDIMPTVAEQWIERGIHSRESSRVSSRVFWRLQGRP